jgi:hypothetical protein
MIMSDNNNGKEYTSRDIATQMKLLSWFNKNKASLPGYATRNDVCAALYADTGIKISYYMCGQYEKALGISRSAGKGRLKPGTNKSKSAEVLARALYAVMQELDNLMQEAASIDSVIPLGQWEQHMKAVKTIAQRRSMESLDANAVPVAAGTQTVNT